MWVLYAFGSALFAGITAVLAKIGIKGVNSHLATALRTVVVAVFAWLMVLIVGSGGTIGDIRAGSWLFLVLSGLATGASWICYFRALQLGSVNQVAPIDKSSTVLTMLLAFLLLRERISLNMLLGMGLILGGTLLMLQRQESAKAEPEGKGWLVWAVLSAVFASLTAILGKVGIREWSPTWVPPSGPWWCWLWPGGSSLHRASSGRSPPLTPEAGSFWPCPAWPRDCPGCSITGPSRMDWPAWWSPSTS